MPLTKVKSGGVSDSITLTSPDINAPDIDGGTIDNAVIGGSTAAAGSFTTITATGGSSSNWNTAYGWGDHSTQSYATQTYVGTEVSNLVDSSPAALDTLNELAAALGDDPNFATTVTNSIALKAPLASPSFTGDVGIAANNSGQGAVLTLENTDTSITTNDVVGQIDFYANDGSTGGTGQKATIQAIAQNSSGTSVGLIFGTSPFPNTTATERMRIDSSGNTFLQADGAALQWKNGYQTITGDAASNDLTYRTYANHIWKTTTGASSTTDGSERMRIDASGKIQIGNNIPMWSGSYGGALFLKGNNATSDRYAQLAIVDSAGAIAQQGLIVSNTGNVGIGVAPAFPFHVQASDGALAQFSNGVDADCTIRTASGVTLITPSTGTLALGTSSTERMRIDSSGAISVGSSTQAVTELQLNHENTGGKGEIQLNSHGTASFSMLSNFTGGTISGVATGGFGLITPHNYPISIVTNDLERLRVSNSGNVGIGTSSPSEKLHVSSGTGNVPALFQSTDSLALITFKDNSTNTDVGVGAQGNNQVFYAGSERMRIDASGNLMVNSTTNYGKFVVENGGNSYPSWFRNTSSSIDYPNRIMSNYATGGQTATMLQFLNGSSAAVGAIKSTASATSYVTSSDQRLKENIADADDAGSKIDAIQVRQYDWKADGSHQDYGMIAQELQAVAPEAVSGDADSEEMMGVDYSKLVPMLIKEIQSLRNRVAQLEA